jgi:hypothetical protein
MEQKSFLRRFVLPVGALLAVMLASSFAYHNSWRVDNAMLRQAIAEAAAVILFASIGFGALIIYPLSAHGGAGRSERIIACLTVPIIWNIMEMARVREFFGFGETLYYGLNQVFLLAVFGAFAQMGLCELALRWRRNRRREEKERIFTAAPLLSIAAGLAAFYVIMLWGMGVHFFYWYGRIYKALFF